jgi:hypothetical protein
MGEAEHQSADELEARHEAFLRRQELGKQLRPDWTPGYAEESVPAAQLVKRIFARVIRSARPRQHRRTRPTATRAGPAGSSRSSDDPEPPYDPVARARELAAEVFGGES